MFVSEPLCFILTLHSSEFREPNVPPKLFPNLISLRLSGLTSNHVIDSILYGSTSSTLKSLDIIALHTWADPESMPLVMFDNIYTTPQTVVVPHRQSFGFDTVFGPMQGHLRRLALVSARLTSLTLMIIGAGRGSLNELRAGEQTRYEEIGQALNSLSPSLRKVTFEQSMRSAEWYTVNGIANSRTWVKPIDWFRRPMDWLFGTYIAPQIFSANWRVLESMELRGVGGLGKGFRYGQAPQDWADLRSSLEQVRRHILPALHCELSTKVPRTACLIIEATARRNFPEYYSNKDTGLDRYSNKPEKSEDPCGKTRFDMGLCCAQ